MVVPDWTAAAGAQNDTEDHAKSRSGTVGRLTEGEAVGVVFNAHLPRQRLRDVTIEAVSVQRDGVRVLHPAGGRTDDAGDADPNCGGHAQL